jgi:hypothetical protein
MSELKASLQNKWYDVKLMHLWVISVRRYWQGCDSKRIERGRKPHSLDAIQAWQRHHGTDLEPGVLRLRITRPL